MKGGKGKGVGGRSEGRREAAGKAKEGKGRRTQQQLGWFW